MERSEAENVREEAKRRPDEVDEARCRFAGRKMFCRLLRGESCATLRVQVRSQRAAAAATWCAVQTEAGVGGGGFSCERGARRDELHV